MVALGGLEPPPTAMGRTLCNKVGIHGRLLGRLVERGRVKPVGCRGREHEAKHGQSAEPVNIAIRKGIQSFAP